MFNFYSSLVRDPCQKESYRRLKTFNQIICSDFAKWGKIALLFLTVNYYLATYHYATEK